MNTKLTLLFIVAAAFLLATVSAQRTFENITGINGLHEGKCWDQLQPPGADVGVNPKTMEKRWYRVSGNQIYLEQQTWIALVYGTGLNGDCSAAGGLTDNKKGPFQRMNMTVSEISDVPNDDGSYNYTYSIDYISVDSTNVDDSLIQRVLTQYPDLYGGCEVYQNETIVSEGCGTFIATPAACPNRYGTFRVTNTTNSEGCMEQLELQINIPLNISGSPLRGCSEDDRLPLEKRYRYKLNSAGQRDNGYTDTYLEYPRTFSPAICPATENSASSISTSPLVVLLVAAFAAIAAASPF